MECVITGERLRGGGREACHEVHWLVRQRACFGELLRRRRCRDVQECVQRECALRGPCGRENQLARWSGARTCRLSTVVARALSFNGHDAKHAHAALAGAISFAPNEHGSSPPAAAARTHSSPASNAHITFIIITALMKTSCDRHPAMAVAPGRPAVAANQEPVVLALEVRGLRRAVAPICVPSSPAQRVFSGAAGVLQAGEPRDAPQKAMRLLESFELFERACDDMVVVGARMCGQLQCAQRTHAAHP